MIAALRKLMHRRKSLPATTLVTEAYTFAEGQSEASFLRAVGEVDRIAGDHTGVTTIVVDPTADGIAAPLLARHFPHIQALHVPGQSYDGQKNSTFRAVESEFVAFLDGDCKPVHDDWLERLITPMLDTDVAGVGGLTLYEDFSTTGIAMSVLDWGFLFNGAGSAMDCYSSNNVAFRRQALLRFPIPDSGLMRCHSYNHASMMLRAGQPLRFEPQALALHELPDIQMERYRRGYEHVAALWADPGLPEAVWLDSPERLAPRLLEQNLELALARLRRAPAVVRVTEFNVGDIEREIRRLITFDAEGIRAAIKHGEANGLNSRAAMTRMA